jgi:hypothetical protein
MSKTSVAERERNVNFCGVIVIANLVFVRSEVYLRKVWTKRSLRSRIKSNVCSV